MTMFGKSLYHSDIQGRKTKRRERAFLRICNGGSVTT